MYVTKKTGWIDALKSVLGAVIGVQSSQVHQRDFQSKSPWRFLIVGLVVTVFLTLGLIFGVKALIFYLEK